MDGKTLMAAMTYPGYPAPLSLARYSALAEHCEIALKEANCGTVARAAMFLAQIGAESGSLRWTQELASGAAYNGRADLGNTHPGDGPRFKGRSFIQITGRYHYAVLSKWAHSQSYIPTSTYFVDHPTALADDRYAFLGPVYYWTIARNMNAYADAHDINGGTYAVNGGYSNLAGRTARWKKCLSLGSALLSGPVPATTITQKESDMAQVVRVDKKDCARHHTPWRGDFLDVGDMHPRHILTKAELAVRVNKQKLPWVTISLAEFKAIGGQ